uniref:CSON006095 protein n=1 Tax=Culicoides sonorensis TaxID=179676 RepID=A0A336L9Y2_CULSO
MSSKDSRFSLLLLEPYEIYFEDFHVDLIEQADASITDGKLKICSKSIVFEPKQIEKPLLKLSYKDCFSIETCKDHELKNTLLEVTTSQYVEMLEENIIAPFKFENQHQKKFKFQLKYVTIEDCIPKIEQLRRAATLPIHEQNSMISTIAYSWYNRINFDPLWFENIYEKVIIESTVNLIKPLVTNPGRLLLTNKLLYFQSFNNIQTDPVLKISLSNIVHLMKRRFMLKQIGLEIVFNQGCKKVLFIAFITDTIRDKFYDEIFQQPNLSIENLDCESIIIKWQNGEISNYDYLLYLNSLADRSFNDLTQYPVFPWILRDYTSQTIDLNDIKIYRNLQKPVGALNEDRLGKLKERYTEMDEPKYLYGSMFSAPGLIIFYLARKFPELMLCLQNGKFDHPDRIFNSISETFKNCMTNMSDFKELIPEFFDTSKSDFLINKKKINFGHKWDGSVVNDIQLPPWAKNSASTFIQILRSALESNYVSANINHWIDLIFGYKQRGEEAVKSDNLFYHLCYEGSINLSNVTDLAARHALEVQILEFGQIPKQIFTTPHPQKLIHAKLHAVSCSVESFAVELIKSFTSFKDSILSLFYSENILISTGKDGNIKCFNIKENTQIR